MRNSLHKRLRLSPCTILVLLIVGAVGLGWFLAHQPSRSGLLTIQQPQVIGPAVEKPRAKQVKFVGTKQRVPDLDGRELKAVPQPDKQRTAALAALRKSVPGVQVEFDPLSAAPSHLQAVGRFLTPPAKGQSARQVVQSFVEQYRVLFGHSAAALESAKVTREDVTAHNGMSTLVWQQQVDEIPVFQTILKANVTKNGELVTISDHFLSEPTRALGKSESQRRALVKAPPLQAEEAIIQAAESWDQKVAAVTPTDEAAGMERKQSFDAVGLTDTKAQLTWMPMSADKAVLAWDVVAFSLPQNQMFRTVVSAESGAVLYRTNLTVDISDATYQVFAKTATLQPQDSPTPFSPGHSTPLSAQPAQAARETITTQALNTTASPNGWINDGVQETLGNNVSAHTDLDNNNAADLPRPNGGAGRNFSFALNLTQQPSTYRSAVVTQLFYVNNWVHDRLYSLGFTETSGNFQTSNFGRGGLGNDAVQADAQDGGGTNNANFSTPPDGSPGRMQMYLFSDPAVDRDGSFDTEIVIHEYGHGLSNRLVGGGVGMSSLQATGMGEGWSDFYALALLSEAGDDPNGCYAAGGYATYQLSGLAANYYFGIRRYPYSTNMAKNPLTLKDIDPTKASAHSGIPYNPIFGVPNASPAQVHNQGEVWCVALWEARVNLVAKHGYALGNERILQMVTDGMKLAPANPTFLQARDAILQADLVNNAAADKIELWSAFAKRGMGFGATVPGTNSTTGVVESFEIPDDLRVTPSAVLAASGQVGGPMTPGEQIFSLQNTGSSVLTWSATSSQSWVSLSSVGGSLAAGASTSVTATLNPQVNLLPEGNYTAQISFTNMVSNAVIPRRVELEVEPILLPILVEDFEAPALNPDWVLTGTQSWRTLRTTDWLPHAGTKHLLMDSSVDNNYSRNEATLTLNLTGKQNVRLKFYAKGFNDESDGPPASPFPASGANFDGVAVSADGGLSWYEVLPLRPLANVWQRYDLDLDAAMLTHGLSYGPNFKIRFNHFDNYPADTDGLAIDDILVAELVTNRIILAAPTALTEGGAAGSATVTVTPTPSSDLTLTLSASNGEVTLPASLTVLAGQDTATFAVTPVNDTLLDGTQTVTITVSAATFADATSAILVHDNETTILTVATPPNVSEGQNAAIGTVTLGAAADADVKVNLLSSNPSQLNVPTSVTVLVGQTSASFPLTVVDDLLLDGTQSATISAEVQGWTSGTVITEIADNETASLALTVPMLREGDGIVTATVTTGGLLLAPLTVTLLSTDPMEAEVPVSVEILAGSNSADFEIIVTDDTDLDGTQPVTISAAAVAFTPASVPTSVADDEVSAFTVSMAPGMKIRNAAFPVTVTARDVNGAVITNYAPGATLVAMTNLVELSLTPNRLDSFADGVWTGFVQVQEFATAAVLTVTGDAGGTGASIPFDVGTGPMDHFSWDEFGGAVYEDQPFPLTLRAVDAGENPITNFNGSVTLGVKVPAVVELLVWGGYSAPGIDTEFEQTVYAVAASYTNYNRTDSVALEPSALAADLDGKHVLLIPAQVNASSGDMAAFGTACTAVLTAFVQSGGTIIVCSYTGDEHTLFTAAGLMSLTKGTTAVSRTVTQPALSDLTLGMVTPFTAGDTAAYTSTNAITALQDAASGAGVVLSRQTGAGRAVMIGTSYLNVNSFMDFAVANAVKSGERLAIPLLPIRGGPATVVNGVWTGDVAVPFPGAQLTLCARTSAGVDSLSASFDCTEQPLPILDGTTVFAENFESGTLGSAWTVTGTGPHRTQITTAQGPHTGARHLVMDSATDGTYARNEATLTLNLADMSGVSLSFHLKGFNDEYHPVPIEGIPETGADFDGVAVSNDGGLTWQEIHPFQTLEANHTQVILNLDFAGLTYTSNYKIRFNHYDNFAIPADGLALDDILVTAQSTNTLGLVIPDSAAETVGSVTGKVILDTKRSQAALIALSSSRPLKVSVPESVLIPAGELEASFTLNVIDDDYLEGDRRVTLTANELGGLACLASMTVLENETTTIELLAPATIDEGTFSAATVRLGTTPVGPIRVSINGTTGFEVPEFVDVLGGTRSQLFHFTSIDNEIIDVGRVETLTASMAGGAEDEADVLIVDNEDHQMSVFLPDEVAEGSSDEGTLSLFYPVSHPLTVSLFTDSPARATIPPTVTIPAGRSEVTFTFTATENTLAESNVPVAIAASAPDFSSFGALVTVIDNEATAYGLTEIPNPQVANAPISVHLEAINTDSTPANRTGSMMSVTATTVGGPVTVTPTQIGPFTGAVLDATVRVPGAHTGVTLTFTDTALISVSSLPFDTVLGGLDHYSWSTVPSPQSKDVGFTATLTARDAGEALLDHNGDVTLTARSPGGDVVTGELSGYIYGPFGESLPVIRLQNIYLPQEVGPARKINNLGFSILYPSGGGVEHFTIRMKHSTKADFTSAPTWESSGWTTVYSGTLTEAQITQLLDIDGWLDLPLSTAFSYNGTDNLMVDISHRNTTLPFSALTYAYPISSERSLRAETATGNPLTWAGSTPVGTASKDIMTLRFKGSTYPVTPVTASLVNGTWTGTVTVAASGEEVELLVEDLAGIKGPSNTFAVQSLGTLAVTLPSVGTEGGAALSGTVTLPAARLVDSVITLTSSAPDQAAPASATVTILAGDLSAPFQIALVDDLLADGSQPVKITAVCAEFESAEAALTVHDNELGLLTLEVSEDSFEDPEAAPFSGVVSLSVPAVKDIRVTLTSSVPIQFSVPVSVTILEGETNASFAGTAIDDVLPELPQTITVTASVVGWATATDTTLVHDNELHHFTLSEITSPQTTDALLSFSITAVTSDEVPVIFSGPLTLTAAGNLGAQPLSTSEPVELIDGSWVGDVILKRADTNVIITATSSSTGIAGSSNAFTLTAGLAHHFAWATVTSPKQKGVPFTTTLTMRDDGGNLVADYEGDAAVSAHSLGADVVTGTYDIPSEMPFATSSRAARSQCIYLPSEIGPARNLKSVEFEITNASPAPMTLTLRLKHTSRLRYGSDISWESGGWTTVFQGSVTATEGGLKLPFSLPFAYDGMSRLLVDISVLTPETTPSLNTQCRSSSTEEPRILFAVSNAPGADPLTWATELPTGQSDTYLPVLRFQGTSYAVLPETVTLAAGTWTGDVSLAGNGDEIVLDALDATLVQGSSNAFSVETLGALVVTLPSNTLEGALPVSGMITLPAVQAADTVVTLTSSDIAQGTVPVSVTVLAGQTQAAFNLTVVDDLFIDGTQPIIVTADSALHASATAVISIEDNETGVLTVETPTPMTEGDGGLTHIGSVSIGTIAVAPIMLSLSSSDTTELVVPASVVIPAGASSISFPINVIDDTLTDGLQNVTLTASVTNWTSGTFMAAVADNDLHHFTLAAVPSPQQAGVPFTISAEAHTISNVLIPAYAGSVTITAVGNTGPIGVTSPAPATFTDGVLTIDVTCATAAGNVRLTLDDSAGHTGLSSFFQVLPGTAHHFAWSIIPSPQLKDQPFTATLTARDAGGSLVTDYTGTAEIFYHDPSGSTETGAEDLTDPQFLNTASHEVRQQVLYTPDEVGVARSLTSLAFNVLTTPGQVMRNFTIRMKHSSKTEFDTEPTWETSGWTTVYQADLNITAEGWLTLPLNSAFAYDGSSSLMVDFSFNNSSGSIAGALAVSYKPASRVLILEAYGTLGIPLQWTGLLPAGNPNQYAPMLRFPGGLSAAVPESVELVSGSYTGPVSVPSYGPSIRMVAQELGNPVLRGVSNAFQVDVLGTLSLSLTANTAAEGGAAITGTVSISTVQPVDTVVTFTSLPEPEDISAASVTILAGQLSAPFSISALDDALLDGPRSVTLLAKAAGFVNATVPFNTTDNDVGTLIVAVPPVLFEGNFAGLASVSITPVPEYAVTVNLSSSDTTEVTVPISVIVEANTGIAYFNAEIVNDTLVDGAQSVTLTASVPTWAGVTAQTSVRDNELHHYTAATISSPKQAGVAFPFNVSARSVDDLVIESFYRNGSALSLTSNSTAWTFSPSIFFNAGQANTNVTINAVATGLTVTMSDSISSLSATTNAFDVTHGPLSRFEFSTIPSPQFLTVPTSTTITAKDALGNTVTAYNGTTNLAASYGSGDGFTTTGTGTTSWVFPFYTFFHDARTQSIYTPAEVGTARSINSLALDISGLPGQSLNNLTIRLKHTNKTSYSNPVDATWETTGWTTVYQSNQTISTTGWRTFNFTTPFAYNGSSHLMVDISYNNSTYTSNGAVRASSTATPRSFIGYSDSGAGDPLTWSGSSGSASTSNLVANLRLSGGSSTPITMTPTLSGTFSSGVWTGDLTFGQIATSARVTATDTLDVTKLGNSNTFDIQSLGPLTLTLASTAAEGASPLAASVAIGSARSVDLIVNLSSTDITEATVPATVTILAGQTGANFAVAIVDDTLIDGSQALTISATASGYSSGASALTVTDNESTQLAITLNSTTALESIGTISGTVSLPFNVETAKVITLSSSSTADVTVPASVTIAAGTSSISFSATVLDDTVYEATENITLTASGTALTTGTRILTITDNDPHNFLISAISAQTQNAAFNITVTARDAANATLTSFTGTTTLSASNGSAVTMTPSTTGNFINGVWTGSVTVTQVASNVQITATRNSATGASNAFNVTGPVISLASFTWSTVSSPQTAGTAFNATITAKDASNATVTNFTGTVNLSALTANGTPIILSPGVSGNFVAGVWTGSLTVGQAAQGLTLTANDGASHTGTSNSFNVGSTAAWFDVGIIPANLTSGVARSVTLTARDSAGNVDTTFTGTANLISKAPGLGQLMLGKGAGGFGNVLNASFHDCRTQTLYTAAQMGGRAVRLNGMALNLLNSNATVFSSFTIRLRHSSKTTYNGAAFTWETTNWTTAYTANQTFAASGWQTISFSTPFDYNGTDSLMLDISFDNTAAGSTITIRADAAESAMMLSGTSNSAAGAPTTWTGSTPSPLGVSSTPQVKFILPGDVALSPQVTTPFVSGVWTGNLTFTGAANDLTLQVIDGIGRTGNSNTFTLAPLPVTMTAEPAFTGGTSNPITWSTSAGATSYETQAATSTTFTTPVWTATPATNSATATGLTHASAYHYRARARSQATQGDDAWTQTDWGDFATANHSGTNSDLITGSVTLGASTAPSTATTENFNSLVGGAWTSLLPVTGGNVGFALASSALTAGPNTTPELPINQGSDLEGRLSGSYAWALGPNNASGIFSDGYVEAYVCVETPAANTSGALLIRAGTGASGSLLGYQANLIYNSATTALINLGYVQSGGFTSSSSFAVSTADVIRLRLTAKGSRLTINAWKVAIVSGVVTETVINLVGSSPNLIAHDTRYSSGRVGIKTFAGTSAFLVEDLTVSMERPVYKTSGTVTSAAISPSVRSQWGVLTYTSDVTASGTSLSVDVLNGSTNTLLASGVASGTNLNSLPAVASVPSLKLRANLATTNTANTPLLSQWSLAYTATAAQTPASAWSAHVSSTQDSSAPIITAPPLHTSSASATFGGTATDTVSGVASVTVNSLAASTSNGYANWTRSLTGLSDGTNTITISASDNAVPPNTSTFTSAIYRISTPGSDSNSNGIPNLIEHALNLTANPSHSQLPASGSMIDSGSGATHLTLQYRRRIQRQGLQYFIDTSTDLITWNQTGADIVETSATPTGDGVTEAVTVRINPAIGPSNPAKFVRIRVTVQP